MPHQPQERPAPPPGEPALSPDQEVRVRGLLADARVEEPMPAEVAARLDWVLSDLASGGPGAAADPPLEAAVPGDGGRPVVPLARRRHRARALLVAAAAVVAAGVAGGQLLAPGADQADTSAAAGASGASAPTAAVDSAGGAAAEQAEGSALSAAGADLVASADPVEIASETFTRDVTRLHHWRFATRDAAELASGGYANDEESRDTSATQDEARAARRSASPGAAAWFSCTPADWGRGRLVAVLYDGEPAVLAFRPRTGDTQVVEVLQCSSGEVLRSVTLPRPHPH